MPADLLERGRASTTRGAWLEAHDALSSADRATALGAEDLERLATAAYMLGRDDEYLAVLERAHQLRLDAGEPLRAARIAFWIGMQLMLHGDVGPASGWLGRAQRLVEREGRDCVERGYLLMPLAFRHEATGALEAGAAVAGEAVAVAERFGDADLLGLATHVQGHFLVLAGRIDDGLRLLDEAMVLATTDALSPIATGIVYCGVIIGCQAAREPRRAQEWTEALTRWCERQPDMVAFNGRCRVHRAELMQMRGAWADAIEEARSAARRAAGTHRRTLGEAAYIQGEVHRLRGEWGAAQRAYREASEYGRDPHPGLALLRLAQGNADAAVAALRRVLAETTAPADRAGLLPACVEIMVAAGDLDGARDACEELAQIATDQGVLPAMAANARGAVDLAAGDAGAALPALRQAWRTWEEIEAPYEAARARALIGEACRRLGDDETAQLELDAARRAFARLGAAPDLARLAAAAAVAGPLTARELEVLRLVAAGSTNRAIAAELVLSERTVDRHVSNILAKLRVSSRAAATAYAYEHGLV